MNVNNANILQILQGQQTTKGLNAPVDSEVQASIDSLIASNPEISENSENKDFASLLMGEEEKVSLEQVVDQSKNQIPALSQEKAIDAKETEILRAQPKLISTETTHLDQPVKMIAKLQNMDTASSQITTKGSQQIEEIEVQQNPDMEAKVLNLKGKSTYFSNPVKKLFKPKTENVMKEASVEKQSNLLKLNDFIAKQSPVSQKRSVASAYKPVSTSMFNKKIEASLPGAVKSPDLDLSKKPLELSAQNENMLDLGSESNAHFAPSHKLEIGVKAVQQQTQVFDLNQTTESVNTREEVLSKVQDYLVQAKVGNEKQVEFSFQHKELGQVDLMVQKAQGDQLNIAIHSHSTEGAKFFTKHQGELLQSLTQNGVAVSDFKLDSSQSSSHFGQDSGRGQFSQGQKQQFGSESGQRQHDSEKRQQLWNQLYDKEVA